MEILQDPEITERKKLLDPEYRKFLETDFFEQTTENYSAGYDLPTEVKEYFFNGLVLYFLFFLDRSDWKIFLNANCKLPIPIAAEIVESILSLLPDGFVQAQSEVFNSLYNNGQKNEGGGAVETKQTPLRTMQQDVDKVHGYGTYREIYPDAGKGEESEIVYQSNQDDTLKKPTLAETPTYDAPEVSKDLTEKQEQPRWGSEG